MVVGNMYQKLLCLSLFVLVQSCATQPTTLGGACSTLDRCMKDFDVYAHSFGSYGGLKRDQSDFAKNAAKLGAPIVDEMIPLLKSTDEGVATMAAVVLINVESIDSKYLPQISNGLDRDIGWLPRALARIDSPEAAEEAVKRYIVSRSAPHNQEASAIRMLGDKAVPFIVKAASCEYEVCPHYLLASVLEDASDEVKVSASEQLIAVVADSKTPDEVSKGILSMFWLIGPKAIIVEPKLLALRQSKPELNDATDYALAGVGSSESGIIFARALRDNPDEFMLGRISSRGLASRDAGVEVVKLLGNEYPLSMRLEAARTLGVIGYKEAADELIALLWNSQDVRINDASAESLGKLKVSEAIIPLQKIQQSHWYPPVRETAVVALERIHGTYAEPEQGDMQMMHFGQFESIEPCKEITLEARKESTLTKLYRHTSPEKIEKLTFESEVLSYTANNEEEQKAEAESNGETPIIEVNAGNMIEIRTPTEEIPDVALRIENGWLAGVDRGEWGGDLVFVGDDGKSERILATNIEDIYAFGESYVAVTGLSHLGMSEGAVIKINQVDGGGWSSEVWRVLPSAPSRSWFVETGELYIEAYSGGSLLLSTNGDFRMAECANDE